MCHKILCFFHILLTISVSTRLTPAQAVRSTRSNARLIEARPNNPSDARITHQEPDSGGKVVTDTGILHCPSWVFPCKFEADPKKGFSFAVCFVVLMLKLQTLDTHRCVCVRLFYTGFSSDNRTLSTHGQLTDCPTDSHGVSDAAGCKEVVCVSASLFCCWCILFVIGCILQNFKCSWRRWKQSEISVREQELSSLQM